MYDWLCSIPSPISFIIIVGFFTGIAVGGIYIFKPLVRKWGLNNIDNDLISFYLSAVGVFYGITLGLLAAGAWQNFNEAEEKVNLEASSLAALYRDVSKLPPSHVPVLQNMLKAYAKHVISMDWSKHKDDTLVIKETAILNSFQDSLYVIESQTNREQAIFSQTIAEFHELVEMRRQRLQSVNTGMNSVVWSVIIIGALLTISICWLFNVDPVKLHVIMNTIIGISIGSLIHLIVMFDSPYLGDVAISCDAFKNVFNDLMK